ncbi:hypothetical protein [Bacillus toyonensis]|uniref:hypothetical protein n=1 Tax=Bacillus toyonensis TaxID=155322 RepID=UPI000BED278B|nr:hypothetical protein [Bacillus toyonensis]PEC68158.1 hypothetical protein CON62_06835 [Bacillus toyonensis]
MTIKTKKSKIALYDLFTERQIGLFTDGNGITIQPDFLFEEQKIEEKVKGVNVLAEVPKRLTDLKILQ